MPEWSVPGYTEVKALGSGGFGDVVLARHDASGTQVAIKYLRRQLLADPEFAELFRAEAAVLASLDDPNVVRLYEYIESPSGAAIVMELVDGVSLRDILARQGATTAEAALVVLQGSLLGLAAAHRRGVVHRDYKPENVLINGDGASKLTDFGIAARAGDSPIPAGTLMYAPPEQFGGSPATPASDVYAATATFYECLTGRPPFTGDTAERLIYQHLAEAVPLEPVPEPLRPLVAAGLAKDPGDRPADGTTLVAELRAVAGAAYGPGWEDRGRSGLAAAALLLAALWPTGGPAAAQGSTVHRISLRRHIRLRHISPVKGAIAAGVVIAVAVAAAVIVARPTGHPTQPPAPGTGPALIYTTSTSVDLRTGNGSVRTLATFPKGAGFTGPQGFGSGQLAWSADGSKVAWLDGQGVGEFIVGRDQVRTWNCDCTSIVFEGDRLLSDDLTAENAPRLLSYPDDGSKPVPIVISGLPKSKFTVDNDYGLDAAVPPADVIVGYGMGVSASGGPQLLYRVNAEGRAVLFAPAARQMTNNAGPGDFVFSPDGTQAGFLLYGLAGVCADGDTVVLANVATGAETQPAMPAGHAIRPRSLVRAIGLSLRFDGTRTPRLRSRWSGHRGQHRRFAPGLPPGGGYLGKVWQRGNQRGIHPRRLGGDALRQGQLHCLGGIRIHRSQAGRVARLFIGDYPGCPDIHVGTVRCADVLPRALRRVLRRVLAGTTAASAGGAGPGSIAGPERYGPNCGDAGRQRRRGLLCWPEPGRDDLQQRRVVASSPAGQARRPA